MSLRRVVPQRLIVDGIPYVINLIDNPTIDDVVVTEMRVQAAIVEGRSIDVENRTVERGIKDFLIRLGVSR
jgi:hypothetical protein